MSEDVSISCRCGATAFTTVMQIRLCLDPRDLLRVLLRQVNKRTAMRAWRKLALQSQFFGGMTGATPRLRNPGSPYHGTPCPITPGHTFIDVLSERCVLIDKEGLHVVKTIRMTVRLNYIEIAEMSHITPRFFDPGYIMTFDDPMIKRVFKWKCDGSFGYQIHQEISP